MPVSFRCHRVSVVTLPFHFLIWRWGTVLGLRSECLLCLESNPELADISSFWPGICHVKTASASSTDTNSDFLNPVFPVHAISSLCKPIPAYSDFYHEQLMSIRFFTCDLMTSVSPCYGTLAWLGLTYQLPFSRSSSKKIRSLTESGTLDANASWVWSWVLCTIVFRVRIGTSWKWGEDRLGKSVFRGYRYNKLSDAFRYATTVICVIEKNIAVQADFWQTASGYC